MSASWGLKDYPRYFVFIRILLVYPLWCTKDVQPLREVAAGSAAGGAAGNASLLERSSAAVLIPLVPQRVSLRQLFLVVPQGTVLCSGAAHLSLARQHATQQELICVEIVDCLRSLALLSPLRTSTVDSIIPYGTRGNSSSRSKALCGTRGSTTNITTFKQGRVVNPTESVTGCSTCCVVCQLEG